MNNDEMLARLIAQAEGDGADLVTLRAIVDEATDSGAARVLGRLGLADPTAQDDIDELRELLRAWRDAKASAWKAAIRWIIRGLLALLLVGVAMRLGPGLGPGPGRLNRGLGPNGAGKSVLRRAFCDLLFGIPAQTPMGFRFDYPRMRLRAEGLGSDGAPLRFGRRKGQGNTLVDAADAPLEPGRHGAGPVRPADGRDGASVDHRAVAAGGRRGRARPAPRGDAAGETRDPDRKRRG